MNHDYKCVHSAHYTQGSNRTCLSIQSQFWWLIPSILRSKLQQIGLFLNVRPSINQTATAKSVIRRCCLRARHQNATSRVFQKGNWVTPWVPATSEKSSSPRLRLFSKPPPALSPLLLCETKRNEVGLWLSFGEEMKIKEAHGSQISEVPDREIKKLPEARFRFPTLSAANFKLKMEFAQANFKFYTRLAENNYK